MSDPWVQREESPLEHLAQGLRQGAQGMAALYRNNRDGLRSEMGLPPTLRQLGDYPDLAWRDVPMGLAVSSAVAAYGAVRGQEYGTQAQRPVPSAQWQKPRSYRGPARAPALAAVLPLRR